MSYHIVLPMHRFKNVPFIASNIKKTVVHGPLRNQTRLYAIRYEDGVYIDPK